MCLALLSLVPDYSNVRPRRPKGGPDGARDIEARHRSDLEIWGAVGFRNSATDSNEDRRWVKEKFLHDLGEALKEKPNLEGFVFLTNVDLTPSQQQTLAAEARKRGIGHVDLIYRERLRILLDSPQGLGFRFQYLEIPLSVAEQAAFFAQFGSQLETLVVEGFDSIQSKLARIEFFHDCERELWNLSFWIRLAAPSTPDELGHFRFLLEIIDLNQSDPHPTLWLAGRDAYGTMVQVSCRRSLPGIKMLAWSCNPDDSLQNTVLGLGMGPIVEFSSFTGVYGKGPLTTLRSLDHKHLNIFVTTPLAARVQAVGIVANDYLLASVPSESLVVREGDPLAEWPESLSEQERAVSWSHLLLKGDDPSLPPPAWPTRNWFIDFGTYTPEKMGQV